MTGLKSQMLLLPDDITANGPDASDRLDDLVANVEKAATFLPAQGPITVFVHHNSLHAFEHLTFEEGVKAGGMELGCEAYLPEQKYREWLGQGRIQVADLEAVLIDDLEEAASALVANFGTRFALRLAMLAFPYRVGTAAELRWMIAESDALRRFRPGVEPLIRARSIESTRRWLSARLGGGEPTKSRPAIEVLDATFEYFNPAKRESWSDKTWDAFYLNFLWRVCRRGAQLAIQDSADGYVTEVEPLNMPGGWVRHRDLLRYATGEDSDRPVHDILIRFCAAFLDQGFADWELPNRRQGMYRSFLSLYQGAGVVPTGWSSRLRREVRRLALGGMGPRESLDESLRLLGIQRDEQEAFIKQSLLALRGWAGMVWQLETNAEWTPRPAPSGSLVEFLAIRLILDRIAIQQLAREQLGFNGPLARVREVAMQRIGPPQPMSVDQQAFIVFQLAQVRGWNPQDLAYLPREQWATLIKEIGAFSSFERRRIYHLAFEKKYRDETLAAVSAYGQIRRSARWALRSGGGPLPQPTFQIACCIDEREESFRRHLEEVDPGCETFGIAGFFGVAMYYRGLGEAHFKPLCPVNIRPRHFVAEQPLYSVAHGERRRANARRRLGQASHQAHRETRSVVGGMLTALLGSLATFPLIARVLFPRMTARIREMMRGVVTTQGTELQLERIETEAPEDDQPFGFSIGEMAEIVEGSLRAMGLSHEDRMAPLVIICGHGSASLNNPHEAAHDCGACGGGRGGPNARAFAQMANDPRVRRRLERQGLGIPSGTWFVGAYHNTCDDSMKWYDLDRVPRQFRVVFERAKQAVDEARRRNAHERCRRFESAALTLSPDEALRHVESRAQDLSQTRPEYGHATNALCFVGGREWSRGFFLDRRAFLTSYDPSQDDAHSSILEKLLQAVIPVCAGINLEYYFSYVDPSGYGCGTKLPHNIVSLLGVMDGAASDLRPGLPWQMTEIHEPVRLLFVVETTCAAMRGIIDRNPAIARLVDGGWVQLAVFDTGSAELFRCVCGQFTACKPECWKLPVVSSSVKWYGGKRDHLGFAAIAANPTSTEWVAQP